MVNVVMLKTIGTAVVSMGSGMIVGNAVKATTPKTVTGLSKILIGAGSLAISGFVADKMSEYTDKQIDSVIEAVKSVDTEVIDDLGENVEAGY